LSFPRTRESSELVIGIVLFFREAGVFRAIARREVARSLDSRVRGNDGGGSAGGFRAIARREVARLVHSRMRGLWIPACAGMTVNADSAGFPLRFAGLARIRIGFRESRRPVRQLVCLTSNEIGEELCNRFQSLGWC